MYRDVYVHETVELTHRARCEAVALILPPGAATSGVSEGTVKTHINNLFSKIGVRDRAQAVAYAFRHGLARD
jgi:hypothetical protein